MRMEFSKRLQPTGKLLKSLGLEFSFRSSQAILRLVDATFKPFHNNGFPQEVEHKAFYATYPVGLISGQQIGNPRPPKKTNGISP